MEICPICLSPIEKKYKTNCGHDFCANCITQTYYYSKSNDRFNCPYCRQDVTSFSLPLSSSSSSSLLQIPSTLWQLRKRLKFVLKFEIDVLDVLLKCFAFIASINLFLQADKRGRKIIEFLYIELILNMNKNNHRKKEIIDIKNLFIGLTIIYLCYHFNKQLAFWIRYLYS